MQLCSPEHMQCFPLQQLEGEAGTWKEDNKCSGKGENGKVDAKVKKNYGGQQKLDGNVQM